MHAFDGNVTNLSEAWWGRWVYEYNGLSRNRRLNNTGIWVLGTLMFFIQKKKKKQDINIHLKTIVWYFSLKKEKKRSMFKIQIPV